MKDEFMLLSSFWFHAFEGATIILKNVKLGLSEVNDPSFVIWYTSIEKFSSVYLDVLLQLFLMNIGFEV
jgi:hypothetical protein